jgi:hypothetical protein
MRQCDHCMQYYDINDGGGSPVDGVCNHCHFDMVDAERHGKVADAPTRSDDYHNGADVGFFDDSPPDMGECEAGTDGVGTCGKQSCFWCCDTLVDTAPTYDDIPF